MRRDEGDDFSLADFEAGYRHFRMVGGPVTADLSSLRQQVAERHTRCHGTQDDCRRNKPSGLLLDGDPAVSFTVPTPVADAWANRVIETYRTHLDALTQRSA